MEPPQRAGQILEVLRRGARQQVKGVVAIPGAGQLRLDLVAGVERRDVAIEHFLDGRDQRRVVAGVGQLLVEDLVDSQQQRIVREEVGGVLVSAG